MIPASYPLTDTPCCDMCLPSYQINKNNLFFLKKNDLKTSTIECLMGYDEGAVVLMAGLQFLLSVSKRTVVEKSQNVTVHHF